ncbi:MAG: carbamoyltransferase HypF [Coriobacteriales bacterium]|nr:carbamoyltransferase HypF [Coriobacteriales bacterium]
MRARDLHISGIVQGVGFRPFVYRLAVQAGLRGWVLNASDGVHVHIEGEDQALADFERKLPLLAPAAAQITDIKATNAIPAGLSDFQIRESINAIEVSTLVSPDIATCSDCQRELFDPSDHRFAYPFINCTNCGPRFTIIDALPYDRPNTSMASFSLCPNCAAEYANPLDRRFHAQPDACFTCGPGLSLWEMGTLTPATNREQSQALIKRVAFLLKQGRIVALKGLGGYHLACDATNQQAVQTLRQRKRRSEKPFALMLRSLVDAQTLCHVNPQEAALLTGSIRPIVLLERKPDSSIAPAVAGNLHEQGIMLPYTPLQHLLLAAVDFPLVMTSGNVSEEPILTREDEAHTLLANIADAFLDNNRAILSRYDDSVVRVVNETTTLLRRARGYAPTPLPFLRLTKAPQQLLAAGPEQKSTFCLTRGSEAFVSQHLGDLESATTFNAYRDTLALYQRLFKLEPQAIALDMHPGYLSSKWARARDLPRVEVQHHHAHIAAVLAEHKATRNSADALIDRVIGIAFDGTGYAPDQSIWGGEVLIASLTRAERFAHLACTPLPGGRAAIDNPARMAYSFLKTANLLSHPGTRLLKHRLGADRCLLLDQILTARINSPLTSSMGRLFDAVSALLGICNTSTYEGQAAIDLEAALYDAAPAKPTPNPRYRFAHSVQDDALAFDPAPVLTALLDDIHAGVTPAVCSLRFHQAIVQLVLDLCDAARQTTGLATVALSGGVFMNRYLLTQLPPLLADEGFTVLLHKNLPSNDGCIAYGQAAVAAAQLAELAQEGILFTE